MVQTIAVSIPPMPSPYTPDHTWKEAVARAVLSLIQRTGHPSFTIDQIYDFTPHLQAQFPGNRHVREKTRQSLQKLVADGILLRTARGIYQLNAASPELQVTTATAPRSAELNWAGARSADTPGSARALTRTFPFATHTPLPPGTTDVPRVQRITSVRLRKILPAMATPTGFTIYYLATSKAPKARHNIAQGEAQRNPGYTPPTFQP